MVVCMCISSYICQICFVYLHKLHSIATGVFKLVPLEERSSETDFQSIHPQDQVNTGVFLFDLFACAYFTNCNSQFLQLL